MESWSFFQFRFDWGATFHRENLLHLAGFSLDDISFPFKGAELTVVQDECSILLEMEDLVMVIEKTKWSYIVSLGTAWFYTFFLKTLNI